MVKPLSNDEEQRKQRDQHKVRDIEAHTIAKKRKIPPKLEWWEKYTWKTSHVTSGVWERLRKVEKVSEDQAFRLMCIIQSDAFAAATSESDYKERANAAVTILEEELRLRKKLETNTDSTQSTGKDESDEDVGEAEFDKICDKIRTLCLGPTYEKQDAVAGGNS